MRDNVPFKWSIQVSLSVITFYFLPLLSLSRSRWRDIGECNERGRVAKCINRLYSPALPSIISREYRPTRGFPRIQRYLLNRSTFYIRFYTQQARAHRNDVHGERYLCVDSSDSCKMTFMRTDAARFLRLISRREENGEKRNCSKLSAERSYRGDACVRARARAFTLNLNGSICIHSEGMNFSVPTRGLRWTVQTRK